MVLLDFYDALIVFGHGDDRFFADRLRQWLQDYGYSTWQLDDPLDDSLDDPLDDPLLDGEISRELDDTPIPTARPLDAATDKALSQTHNLLIVATSQGYPTTVIQTLGKAVDYHKRLFLLHPLPPPSADHQRREDEAKIQAFQALTTLLQPCQAPPITTPWIIPLALHLDGDLEGDVPSPSLKRLMALLQDQEAQIHQHTHLLVQALAWEQNDYASPQLLTDTALTRATQWLSEVSAIPSTCRPTPLQTEFIAASCQYADTALFTVLLAYAEEDCSLSLSPAGPTTVEALRHLLQQAGITFWDCHQDCPPAIDLGQAISRATEACDNYVILLSPNAIHNATCLQGLLFALSMNKRIIPLLIATVETEQLPEPLQGMAWVDLRGATPPLAQSTAGRQLLQILRNEADYHRIHTQLLMAALRWERQQRHPSGLLSPPVARTYQRWLQAAQRQPAHQPIYLQTLFVEESLAYTGQSSDLGILWTPIDHIKAWLRHWMSS
jgi:hypothetical protein